MAGKFQDHCAYPPRMMNADRAAAYLDISKTKFLEGVEKGVLPLARDVKGLPRWDRRDLDAAVDAMSDRKKKLYPDSTIVRKTACHGAILGFVIGA